MSGLIWPWVPTVVLGGFRRYTALELASLWGEAMWTARDLWEPAHRPFRPASPPVQEQA